MAAVATLSLSYQAMLFALPGPTAVTVKDVVMVMASLAGMAVAGARAYREHGGGRRTWLLVAVTSTAFTAGNVLYALADLYPAHAPGPGPAGLCMLVAAALIPATLLTVPTAPSGFDARCRMLLDGLISTAVLFFLSWSAVMRTMVETARSGPHVVLALAVPSIEIASVAMVTLQLVGRRRSAALTLMGFGFGAFAVTSTASMYLMARQLPIARIGLEGGFLGATLLLIAAARQPMPSVEQRRWEPATGLRGSVPYLGAGAVVGTAAVLQARHGNLDPVLLWAVLLVAGLVLLRQFLSLRVNDRLVRELHRQRTQLSHQASHDQLTGLANRYLLDSRLREALARVTGDGGHAAVLLVDLDGFKPINDSFGHAAGDLVLVATARRLTDCVRAGDTVARLGGDEFAVLLEGLTDEVTVNRLADRLLTAVARPVTIDHATVSVTASIGVALARDPDRVPDPEALLHQADLALYRAKTEGKHRARRYAAPTSGSGVPRPVACQTAGQP